MSGTQRQDGDKAHVEEPEVVVDRHCLQGLQEGYAIASDLLFSRVLDHSSAEGRAYRERQGENKTVCHWGQRKLMLAEIEFLTRYHDRAETVVYAGAAPGTHILCLAKLFPRLRFVLVDPRPFSSHLLKAVKELPSVEGRPRIEIQKCFFTDDLARQYAEKPGVLFVSDVRTSDDGASPLEAIPSGRSSTMCPPPAPVPANGMASVPPEPVKSPSDQSALVPQAPAPPNQAPATVSSNETRSVAPAPAPSNQTPAMVPSNETALVAPALAPPNQVPAQVPPSQVPVSGSLNQSASVTSTLPPPSHVAAPARSNETVLVSTVPASLDPTPVGAPPSGTAPSNETVALALASAPPPSAPQALVVSQPVVSQPTPQEVENDMDLQQRWHVLMRPLASSFKFRLPWMAGVTRYLEGEIYLPVWGPVTTTESRLFVETIKKDGSDCAADATRYANYDNRRYEQQMFYFNTHRRIARYRHDFMDYYKCSCYDCTAEAHILATFLRTVKVASPDLPQDVPGLSRLLDKECHRDYQQKRTLFHGNPDPEERKQRILKRQKRR